MHVKENKLLLSGLPKYYGLKQVPLQYTLVGYDEDWLVIGTEVGVLICYNDKSNVSFRIPPQGYSKIECLELKERVLVWGTESGYVGIKEIQSGSDTELKQMISKVHDTNVKFASYHDNKVASVDKDGKITISEVDWARGIFSSSRVIHCEPNKILSLFFISAELILLTTVIKTSLLKMENETCSVTSVGSKDRKNGEFGACVLDIYTVLVARPGLRLWYANTGGDVLKTIQLRKILNECPLECCCEDLAEDIKLASLLPKSGIINRVERIDEKLVIIQLKHLFVFVETVDLTVVGWLKESVLDWYTSHRALVLLYKDNIIKRYIVTQNITSTNSEFGSISENVENDRAGGNIAHNEQTQSVTIISENGNIKSENGQLAADKTQQIDPHKPNEIITQIPKYQPVPKEKLEEITNFVKSICERDENSEIIPLQKVPDLDIVSSVGHSVSCEVTKLSDDAKYPFIDSLELSCDVIKPPCDVIKPPCDVIKPPCDVIKPPCDVIMPPCDVIKPPCDLTEVKVTIEKTNDEDENNLNFDLSGRSTEEHTEHTEHTEEHTEHTEEHTDHTEEHTEDHTDPSYFCDHTLTPNDDTLISCDNTMTPQDRVTNSHDVTCNSHDVTCDSHDVTCESSDVTCESSDVTPTTQEPSIIVTSGGSDNMESSVDLEMSVTDSVTSTSPERSVMEELKTNIGKKMITSLGLTPSPSKHKQLITSDSTLPLYEPDKISLSSQDTISIHSSSTNCDEDEDKIAIRIKRKKHRSRKEKTSSNDTLDSVAGVTIVEEGQEPTFLPTNIPQQYDVSPVLQLNENAESVEVTEMSCHVTEESDAQPQEIGLDVSSILIGLANLEEGILRLDDLGLPVYEFDDPYSDGEEDVDSDEEIGDTNDQDDKSSVRTSSSTILDGDLSSNISDNISTSEHSQQRFDTQHKGVDHKISSSDRRKHQQSYDGDTSDIYSTRSASESTADLYDLERRPSVEFGEDPLTTEAAASPPPHQLTVPSPLLLGEKSGGREDSVFLTDDSWLELRGPTMSRMYVTISCLAVSNVSVWCTDNWGNVYYSPNTRGNPLSWDRVSGAKLVSLSVSDSGNVVWGVTTNKRAVVRFGIEYGQPQGTDWSEMMLEALTVAVDETSVWLLVAKGKQRLFYRSGVSFEDPQGEKWVPVSTQNLNITSLSVNSSVVWGVLDSGKLVIRHGITPAQPLGNSWHVLSVNNVKRCHVGRSWEVGWVVDSAGIVHFQCGVVPSKPRGSNLWWQVSVSEQLGSNFVTHTVGLFSMRRRTLDVKQVCTSAEGGVWLLSNYNTLHRRYGIITGHNWANISRTLISGRREQWQTLAGEGAYPDISGPVWGLTMAGDIVCFTRSSPPRPLEPPCSQGRVVHIAATTNVLWAVDQSGQIHVREGLARDDVLGTHWQTLNMTQLMGVLLHKLSCSDRGVWAVDTTGTPWFRTGCYAGKDIVQAWVRVESNSLKFREVSSAGSLVWGVDGRNSVYVRTGVSYSLPVGSDWEQVPGLQCLHVRAAHEGVVALSTSQHLVYRYGACPTLPAGNYWRKVPGPPPDGSVSLITTLKGGGVWCQSGRSNLLYRRRVRTVPDKGHVNQVGSSPAEEGWEVV